MARLTGLSAEPAYLEGWASKLDHREASLDGFIDELLATDRFTHEVMPTLLFGAFVNVRDYFAFPATYVLDRGADNGPYYLREQCKAADAVAVHPWWDLASEVMVCPDSYRPEKWTIEPGESSYRTTMGLTCDSQVGSPELETKSLCGCGPNLIRCLRDQDQYRDVNKSIQDEVKSTTAYIVEHDLPMATLFTGNETFRDRNVELYYRRQKIEALQTSNVEHELADLGTWPVDARDRQRGAWPEAGKWAPREELAPGEHAGVLTAPQILHWLPDRRQRQRAYYEVLWCNLRNSFGATTHKVLELNTTGNIAFTHDSWKKLANTELCMTCHARLDYGFQFFMGFPDSRASTHFNPALQSSAKGPLYGQDIRDLRGEGPLTPHGFATLATAQPDFTSCMTSHFVNYVLGDRATTDDIAAIEAVVEGPGTFKRAMKVALERFAAKWRDTTAGPAPQVTPPDRSIDPKAPAPVTAGVRVGAALRVALDKHCAECHDETPYTSSPDGDDVPFDFTAGELPRSLVVSMADRVAFAMMPKNEHLDTPVREQVVELLIDALWTDPQARAEAERYYLGRARGLPGHQIDNVLHSIDQVAGARPEIGWGALERGIWADQATITPGFLATTSLEALRACALATKPQGVTLEACLLRATSLDQLSRWPP